MTTDNADEYAQKLNNVLDGDGYVAHVTRSGSIGIYKKGDKQTLKNLKAYISSSDYIDWGGNQNLKLTLEPLIKKVFDDPQKKKDDPTATKTGVKDESKKVTLKQIFEDVQGLNPSTSTISSLGSFVSTQNQQLADDKRKELMGYLPKESLAYKIASTASKFTDKQLWVIAYELEKNDKYKTALSDFLEDVERKERLRKEKAKKKRQAKAEQQKMIDERQKKNNAIAVGDVVEHPQFGEGKVISITDEVIKVSFKDIGEKALMKKFVNLNKK